MREGGLGLGQPHLEAKGYFWTSLAHLTPPSPSLPSSPPPSSTHPPIISSSLYVAGHSQLPLDRTIIFSVTTSFNERNCGMYIIYVQNMLPKIRFILEI